MESTSRDPWTRENNCNEDRDLEHNAEHNLKHDSEHSNEPNVNTSAMHQDNASSRVAGTTTDVIKGVELAVLEGLPGRSAGVNVCVLALHCTMIPTNLFLLGQLLSDKHVLADLLVVPRTVSATWCDPAILRGFFCVSAVPLIVLAASVLPSYCPLCCSLRLRAVPFSRQHTRTTQQQQPLPMTYVTPRELVYHAEAHPISNVSPP